MSQGTMKWMKSTRRNGTKVWYLFGTRNAGSGCSHPRVMIDCVYGWLWGRLEGWNCDLSIVRLEVGGLILDV
jgi:hypothetical protein